MMIDTRADSRGGAVARFHRSLLLCLMLASPAFGADASDTDAPRPSRPAGVEHLSRPPVIQAEGGSTATGGAAALSGQQKAVGRARAGEAIASLQQFARTTRSATGRFEQTQVGARHPVTTRGRFAFSRPGKFRWEIESPDQQLIVTDGKKLHFHDKDLQQVTVREAGDAFRETPAAVLFGFGDLNERFRLSELGVHGGVAWVEAIPRALDSGFDRIRVGMRDGQPVAMEVSDAFGQINRYHFTELRTGVKLPDTDFNFVPPPGVDVLE
ncbi:MAG: outer membrane lipoprotein carrier protein LolA [Lautropia sp.]|nr:outer membrane lipoprotein carrier protein LolA [Lautropia sp.]